MLNDTKTYKTLSALDRKILKSFSRFVNSPYFNTSEHIVELFEIYYRLLLNGNQKEIGKQETWSHLYPDEPYNDARLRKLNSDLHGLLLHFFSIEKYKEDKFAQTFDVLDVVKERNLEHLKSSLLRQSYDLLENATLFSADFYLNRFKSKVYSFGQLNNSKKKFDPSNFDVNEVITDLDIYYLTERLKYICSFIIYSRVLNIKDKPSGINLTLRLVQSVDLELYPTLDVYYNLYSLINSSHDLDYQKYKELLSKYLHVFPFKEQNDLMTHANNFCVQKINSGNPDYYNELFSLYKLGLRTSIYLRDEKFSTNQFTNIIVTGLRLKEFAWVEDFINNYGKYLNDKERTNVINLNLGRMLYYKGEFQLALDYLNKVIYNNIGYELITKALLINSYYETDQYDLLESLLVSFKVFLNRHKKGIPDSRRNNYLNLIKYVKKLNNISPNNKDSLEKLKESLQQEKHVANKSWLLEKIDEF